ncbi:MAG: histidine kinase [Verrucomicrobia subdivision 3 bacterium]|nr:histidine kinase [Limisphaerales bacterium]
MLRLYLTQSVRQCHVFAWATVLCALMASSVPGADMSMRGYHLETYDAERGLPQNTVRALAQARDGYIWVGTPFGLARLDGVSFKRFGVIETPGFVEENCTSLAVDRGGNLWVGTADGLLCYRDKRFERFTTAHGMPDNRINSLCASREGGVWAATKTGVTRIAGQTVMPVPLTRNWADTIFEDRQGRVWYAVSNGVHFYDPARSAVEIVIGTGRSISAITEDHNGTIWFGDRDGLHCWKEGKLQVFRQTAVSPDGQTNVAHVLCILGDRDTGGLWVGLEDLGLHFFHNGTWSKACPDNLPQLRDVRRAIEDAEGNFWFGTGARGLFRLRKPRLQSFGVAEGLPHDKMWSVWPRSKGGVWASGDCGFAFIDADRAVPSYLAGPRSTVIRSIYEDRTGRLWLGDHDNGIYKYESGAYERIPVAGKMRTIYEDSTGAIWVGHSLGMARFKDGVWTHYERQDGLPHEDVRAFLEDRQGTLWLGTYGGGACTFRSGQFERVHEVPGNKAWTFHEDVDGVIWIGTGLGLCRYEQGRTFVFTRQHGLFDERINHLVEDDAGMLWISCNRGIYRVSRKELNDVAAGRLPEASYVAYGEADGMISSETNGEYQPAGCKTPDGRVWFPTQKGIVVIDPKRVFRNEFAPPVIVEQVTAVGRVLLSDEPEVVEAGKRPRAAKSSIRIEPGGGRVLEIRYTANSFVDPSKVRFKYRLEGHDTDWHSAGTRRIAYYTNLRPGSYRFHVLACNNHGHWNEKGAAFAFSIQPHFYQTWTFYLLCGAGAIMTAAAIQRYRLRVQRKLLFLEQQAALQRERARIAQDMHDDLGSSLTKIAILSEVAKSKATDPAHVRSTADTISELARKVIDNIGEIVWVTNPRNDSLDNLAAYLRGYAAEFLDETAVQYRIDFAPNLPAVGVKGELRRDILLVFKETLNNVVKHAEATEVLTELEFGEEQDGQRILRIRIRDNGRGFDLADSNPANNGFSNMRERIVRRGGSVIVSSATGGGTAVVISVPLRVGWLRGQLRDQN